MMTFSTEFHSNTSSVIFTAPPPRLVPMDYMAPVLSYLDSSILTAMP